VLLAIREPDTAADALLESKPFLSRRDALAAWVRFHRPLAPVAGAIVVATFEQILEDLADAVVRLNARFRTTLVPPDAGAVERAAPDIERAFRERTGRGLPLIGRTTDAATEARRDVPTDAAAALERRALALYERLAPRA
jgi:hypothetical protein